MGYQSTDKIQLTTAWEQIAAANEPVLFQRVSGYEVIYLVAEDEPEENSEDGHRLNDYLPLSFTANNPVWARSVGDSVLLVSLGDKNPVITAPQKGTSSLALALSDESVFVCHGFTLPAAGSGIYNQYQLWNPVGSGVTLVVYGNATWAVGVVSYQINTQSTELSATQANKSIKNTTIGSSVAAQAKIYTATTNTVPAAEQIFEASVNTQNPSGGSVLSTTVSFTIKEGQGLTFTQKTANIALNAFVAFGEVKND